MTEGRTPDTVSRTFLIERAVAEQLDAVEGMVRVLNLAGDFDLGGLSVPDFAVGMILEMGIQEFIAEAEEMLGGEES